MKVLVVFMLLVCSGSVFSDGASLVVPCATDDIECLSKSTETFLEQTHKGIPAYDIVTIDPLFIPSNEIAFENEGLLSQQKNLTVTGLRNQKISDFKMDTTAKSVVLSTKVDLTIAGDVTVTLTKSSKSFSGHFTSQASVLGTATYSYELQKDDQGVEHFEVGPETITCKVVDALKDELSPELRKLSDDPDFHNINQEKKKEFSEKTFCNIVEKAYTSVVHNIRSAAKVLPASSFFKNIK